MTIDGHKLSGRETCDFKRKRITFHGICEPSVEFLLSNFRGAVSIIRDEVPPAYALISPEGFALIFKLLLKEIYGRSVLCVNLCSENKNEMSFICSWTDAVPDKSFIDKLSFIARESGFNLNYIQNDSEERIVLTIKEDKTALVSLYAINKRDILSAFNLIFYT